MTEEVPAAPADVRNFYVTLENLKQLHPLIVSVRTVSRRETSDGYEQTYRITDRIPLWRWHLTIRYCARVRVPATGDVSTSARQFPRVRLDGTVSFEPVDGGTRLVERLRIAAPAPLAALTTRQAAKAHVEMLANIRRRFENGQTPMTDHERH